LGEAKMLENTEREANEMNGKRGYRYEPLASKLRVIFMAVGLGLCALVPLYCDAATTTALAEGIVTHVAVTGGVDTINPGTTCVKLDFTVSASCNVGYIAIPKNNATLINALLTAKAANRPISIWYGITDTTDQHCPQLAFTRCVAISVVVR
jgi:hypothetical protein